MPHGSDFTLVFRRTLGTVVIHVDGVLDEDAAPTLRERLVDIIDGQGNRDVVVDLRGTSAVHSSGLVVLVDALKRMEDYGGELVLSGPTSWVAAQLRAAGLHKLFLITPEWRHPARGRLGINRRWEHQSAQFN